ncbi:MAG: response regulator [Deltaproteobacteria bacterium]|nr:response regulator [Deltaproteobacteria bacterium]
MAKQVLIIEDDDGVGKAMAELLVGLGEVTAVIAKNGATAVEKFGQAMFDLVTLDILLPGGMDGYKVAEAIRERSADVPIVVISGFVKDPKVQKDLQTRFNIKTILQKPMKPDEAKAAFNAALGLRATSTAAAIAPEQSGPTRMEGFSVDLGDVPVPMLFGELFRRKAEGVLDLIRGNTKKRFYFQRGFFRYATSNVKAETISGLLAAKGVPDAKINQAMATAKQEGATLTDALVELRVIAERDVNPLLVQQTEEVATTALSWTEGSATFKPSAVDSGPEGRANPVIVVLKGLKRLSTPEQARAALSTEGKSVLERTPEFERELFAIRAIFGGEAISPAINGKLTVAELLGRAKPPDLVLLQGLFATGLARVKGQMPVTLGARPAEASGPQPTNVARPATSPVNRRHTAEEQDARKLVQAEHKRLAGATTHYQVLGVDSRTDAAGIKSAYFGKARQFHADSFAGLELGDAQPLLEEVFKRITEANRVLSSEDERATYDLILSNKAKGLPTSVEQIMQAEATFQRAEGSRKAGRLKDAEKLYREAVGLNAGDANYIFQLAQLVHQLQGKSGASEVLDLLDKSLKIKQDNLAAQVLRGQLLLDAGKAKEALEIGRHVMGASAGFPGAMDLIKAAKAAAAGGGATEGEKGGLFGKLFGGKGK